MNIKNHAHSLFIVTFKGSCYKVPLVLLIAFSFFITQLQLLKLVLRYEESSTLKSFGYLIQSLIKVVHLNRHLLLKLKLVL